MPESAQTTPDAGTPVRDPRLIELVLNRAYTRSETPFTLSSGGTSHDYVDLRRAVSRGDDLRLAAEVVIAALGAAGIEFDAIGGMTMGADQVSHAVALLSGCGWYSVRKGEKTHGSRRRIEGIALDAGVDVVVFEDTVSTGRSLLEALEVVEASGANVLAVCTLLDRGDALSPILAARSVRYLALSSYHDLGIDPIVPATVD